MPPGPGRGPYLGYRVGRGSVKPQDGKVQTIRTWPRPQTKKQVKSFLGLVGYYQRFIPNFATLASPLHELTWRALPNRVAWTDEIEDSFSRLRQALCTEPLLITPDFNLPFVVQDDTNARVTRWFLALQDYHFQLFHRPGRAHANADTLSQRDACLGLTRGTPGLLLRVGVCGNPAPADLEETRQLSVQRPLYGQVVQGR